MHFASNGGEIVVIGYAKLENQEQLLVEINELRWQLKKANRMISAIREGEIESKDRSREILDINTTLVDEATKQQAAQETLQDLNARLEDEATKRQAAQEALQELNIRLEDEATKRQAAQETLQDLNAKLEEEATKRQAAQEALQELNIRLEEEATKRQAAQETLQDLNAKLEEEATKRQAAQEALQELNLRLEEEATKRQIAQEEMIISRDALLRNEVQLRYYSDELLETNNELTSFANSIAHDFRSPMVNLKGFSRELGASLSEMRQYLHDESVGLPDKVQEKIDEVLDQDVPEALNFIYASVDRLDRMVNALLGLARIGRRELIVENVKMDILLDQVCQSFQHQIETKNIQVTVGILPVLTANNMAMEQITGNLVDNAIKYLMTGRPGKISVTCKEENEGYVFCVEDNGRGIAESDYEKIFQVFRRAGQQDVPGDGMGLAYVRKVVRQFGGRVWCESEVGVGTKMMFTVPKK